MDTIIKFDEALCAGSNSAECQRVNRAVKEYQVDNDICGGCGGAFGGTGGDYKCCQEALSNYFKRRKPARTQDIYPYANYEWDYGTYVDNNYSAQATGAKVGKSFKQLGKNLNGLLKTSFALVSDPNPGKKSVPGPRLQENFVVNNFDPNEETLTDNVDDFFLVEGFKKKKNKKNKKKNKKKDKKKDKDKDKKKDKPDPPQPAKGEQGFFDIQPTTDIKKPPKKKKLKKTDLPRFNYTDGVRTTTQVRNRWAQQESELKPELGSKLKKALKNTKNLTGVNSSSYLLKVGECQRKFSEQDCNKKGFKYVNGRCYSPRYALIDNTPGFPGISGTSKSGLSGLIPSMAKDLLSFTPDKLLGIFQGQSVDGVFVIDDCPEGFENYESKLSIFTEKDNQLLIGMSTLGIITLVLLMTRSNA